MLVERREHANSLPDTLSSTLQIGLSWDVLRMAQDVGNLKTVGVNELAVLCLGCH